jgi:anti-anti-sigma factor
MWFIRLEGDVRHMLGPALNTLVDLVFRDTATRHVLVDLSQVENIDSTCLGILARLAIESRQRPLSQPTLVVEDSGIMELLEVVCFDRLFKIVPGDGTPTPALQVMQESPVDEKEMLSLVLDAHRRLCAIDDKTRDVFIDVVKVLEQEQKRAGP